jgi:hypothetical protein
MAFIATWRLKDRQRFLAVVLRENALCFEIGANHGEYTAALLSAEDHPCQKTEMITTLASNPASFWEYRLNSPQPDSTS